MAGVLLSSRVEAFEADLCFHLGPAWRAQLEKQGIVASSPPVAEYVGHLQARSPPPHALAGEPTV